MESLEEKIHLADAIRLKTQKNAELLANADKKAKTAKTKLSDFDKRLAEINTRLKELESGKGRCLTNLDNIHIYEYWIETPAYSGPIRGTSATVRQTGNIQHIPITKGTSRGGFASAAIGAQMAGPTGAAVGGILGRKNEVETTIKTVDNRQFHVDIKGRDWAWSVTLHSGYADKVSPFRDLINILGSSNDDPKVLLAEHRQKHDLATTERFSLFNALESATTELKKADEEYKKIKADYVSQRASFIDDAKYRWSQISSSKRILLYLVGPVPVGICFLSPVAILSGHLTKEKAITVVVAGVLYIVALFFAYFRKYRSC